MRSGGGGESGGARGRRDEGWGKENVRVMARGVATPRVKLHACCKGGCRRFAQLVHASKERPNLA